MRHSTDILVIGSGIAGLFYALKAADLGTVTIITKRSAFDSATAWAQGGISAVLDPCDSFDQHAEDTMRAGAGLCREETVRLCVTQGPSRIRELIELGVAFTREPSEDGYASRLDLGREGGHTKRRVVHARDMTGAEVQRALVEKVRAHPRIRLMEDKVAIDLITAGRLGLPGENRCLGAYVIDRTSQEVSTWTAKVVVLATGGAGKVYLYTSNPDVSTGDGLAMAFRAGAGVANMEFFQFHPTCLFHPKAKSFLISEALRGEGGILELNDGTTFMERYHEMECLAPRDVVARAIDSEMKRTGDDYVVLRMTHLSPSFVRGRFPGIHEKCLQYGVDMTIEPIPVVPAAHYACGGVLTDLRGCTNLPGLLAIGETACTGFNGANRLASNSLLEGLVFAHEAASATAGLLESLHDVPQRQVPDWNPGEASEPDEQVVVTQNWDEIRRLMWNYVGIVRTTKRLKRAQRRLQLLRDEIREYYWDFQVTPNVVELRNICTVAQLIVECALGRKESRGLHYTLDHPERNDSEWCKDTVLCRKDLP